MRILITTQVFPPEIHPTAVMVGELASYLASAGHAVTVATGYPHHPHGRLLGGYEKSLLLREARDGYRVLRGWHITSEDMRVSMRAAVMASQSLGTALAAGRAGSFDVVVNYGPPLAGPLVSAALAVARRAKVVSVIYDLYPDLAIETGALRNRALIAAARAAERAAYAGSHRVVVLSEGFRRALLARGVPVHKLSIIPVWLDADEVAPRDRNIPWRSEQGIGPDTKVVLYAGTIGLVSGASIIAEAAERLAHREDVLFLMVGEGRAKDDLERVSAERGLRNIRFLPLQPRARLAEVQASADLSLVTLAPGRGRTSVPSKVVGYMAAGRPVVASVDLDSDTAHAVRDAGCGAVVPPGDGAALADAIGDLLSAPEERRTALGAAARQHFEKVFTRTAVVARMSEVLEKVVVQG